MQSATSELFFQDENIIEVQPRLKPRRFRPKDPRLIYIPWLISGILVLVSCIVLIAYGIQFGQNKSLSFMKSNVVALILAVVLVEPLRSRLDGIFRNSLILALCNLEKIESLCCLEHLTEAPIG